MPSGSSPFFSIIEKPIRSSDIKDTVTDDWKWKEGRPPSFGSPLIPKAYHPWHRLRWASEKIVSPKLSFQGVIPHNADSTAEEYKLYTLPYVTNSPSFVKDYHIISLRKMVEQLFSPKIDAHIHLRINGEIFVKPLYAITHGKMQAAEVYEYLESAIPPTNPEKPYILSVSGFYSSKSGHSHYWNAGASGFNNWKGKLCFNHGGSIREDIGNYEIIKIEHQLKKQRFYRKVYSQDGDNIWTMDYDAYVRKLHLIWYDRMVNPQFIIGFAIDSGDYWATDDNTEHIDGPGGPGRTPRFFIINGESHSANVVLSACTLPVRENFFNPWFPPTKETHDPIRGYEIKIDHTNMLINCNNRFLQQAVYSPDLGESVKINNPLQYFAKEEESEWIEGDNFEIHFEEADIVELESGAFPGSKWITSLIGTKVTPTFRVTFKDRNDNIRVQSFSSTELYRGSDINLPEV